MLKPLGVNNHRVHLKKLAKLFANACNAHSAVRSTRRSGKNISAREKDWDERLWVFESRKLGVWGWPSLEPTNSIRTHTQSAGPTRKGVTSTLIRTLRSDDLTAAKTSLKKRIRVLSVFIAIVPTHFVKIDVGEPSRKWISKKHIQWNEEMIVAENAIYAIA